jgi:hypothetical protein
VAVGFVGVGQSGMVTAGIAGTSGGSWPTWLASSRSLRQSMRPRRAGGLTDYGWPRCSTTGSALTHAPLAGSVPQQVVDDKHVTTTSWADHGCRCWSALRPRGSCTSRGMTIRDGQCDGQFAGYTVRVSARLASRRRPKVTATLDPDLLASVDAYVAVHPDLDRSAVIDEALRLWGAHQLEVAMAAQFASPDGVDPAERHAWDQLRRAATAHQLDPHHSA